MKKVNKKKVNSPKIHIPEVKILESKTEEKICNIPSYSARIKVLGKLYNSTGNSAREAIENLKPSIGKGMSILTISKDNRKIEKILSAPQTYRLFSSSRMMREIALKNVSMLFTI